MRLEAKRFSFETKTNVFGIKSPMVLEDENRE